MSKVDIQLRGKTFSIACAEGQEDHLIGLGEKLNARLEELEATIGDVGDLRLLVAAGLSLVDEIETAGPSSDADLDNRITLVERSAAAALNDAADRISQIARRVEQAC